ncbi:hypothetical protein C5167_024469 [Papaver somniferum]|uniref:protein-serine/threonine phosphatase n=1 Tax=Papaver somniferum TaxID=3469 RepID=A0A4Y7JSM7_PAPSO|nr:probable protein phosphatase 2C 2 [Papaver somniferum]RZC62695.1 hypothetical protein C5167_024469 [Papaver somniferum]
MIAGSVLIWSFSIISLTLYSIFQLLKIIICKYTPSSLSPWRSFRSRVSVLPMGITLLACKDQTGLTEKKETFLSLNDKYPAEKLYTEEKEEESMKMNCNKSILRKKKALKLVIPEISLREMRKEEYQNEFEIQGGDYCLASRRGRREIMEDGYGVINDIMGDPKQAFFGVFDGHGGRAAMEYVVENLGKNIVSALGEVVQNGEDGQLENAIKEGYTLTDKDFLRQDVSSGACAATALLKNGELYVANAGDCRVVLSRNGVAHALTSDHHVNREDERFRIQNSGGNLSYRNGVWRVQGSLAVTRAIGDVHLKEWVISEPEIEKIRLTTDCEFLIIATDGLWEKVGNQEAVDLISRENRSIQSCKKLIQLSSSRGGRDDITVMVVDLQTFKIL